VQYGNAVCCLRRTFRHIAAANRLPFPLCVDCLCPYHGSLWFHAFSAPETVRAYINTDSVTFSISRRVI
jgi:hypothetical protein